MGGLELVRPNSNRADTHLALPAWYERDQHCPACSLSEKLRSGYAEPEGMQSVPQRTNLLPEEAAATSNTLARYFVK